MNHKFLKPRQALNKAFLKVKPVRTQIEIFKGNLIRLMDQINESESEEFHKNLVSDFLKRTYYEPDFSINTKGRNDMVIHNGKDAKSPVGVILEAKKPTNRGEMLSISSEAKSIKTFNVKSFQELVLYFLRERITQNNLEVKHLVVTNIYEWFVFDAAVFEKAFAQNKVLVKDFKAFEDGRLSGNTTDFFYKEIASREIDKLEGELPFTYFDLRNYDKPLRNADKKDDVRLVALFKLLSPEHLLKLPFINDSNSLDKRFYSELLHIIGLSETKEGGKKLIGRNNARNRNGGSILENAIVELDSLDKIGRLAKPSQFGDTNEDRLFNVGLELSITWINRILFLKLLEAQLITYHKGDKPARPGGGSYSFLNLEKIKNYDDLNSLFFKVLARKYEDRSEEIIKAFGNVPYLNSSLFEPTDMEHNTLFISNLRDEKTIPIISSTVLKNEQGKKRTGKLSTLEYLFEFLNAYDFSSEGSEDIQEDNKTLINASVLGLIFEKINGYKDGSFFTPGFITMYMCRETIRRAVVQKFKESGFRLKEDSELSESLDQIYDQIEDRKKANEIVNSIKICDPAVGSGHFLVSALNEMIAVKNDLKILQDRNGKRLKEYQVEVVNDELIVTDEEGELFEYNPSNKESQRIQETLFHEKQTIIENCLFGVDINPNSVKICRLRLWIELLKSAYYKELPVMQKNSSPVCFEGNEEVQEEYKDLRGLGDLKGQRALETLPNIDINIKCGNSLVSRFAIDADLSEALKKSKFSIESYRMAVTTYRNAQNKEEKREMERLITEIKSDFRSEIANNDPKIKRKAKLGGELYNLTMQTGLFEESAKQKKDRKKKVEKIEAELVKLSAEIEEIKNNKIYENAFEWRFEFPEVLNETGDFVGFDVVIGNPPYISHDKIEYRDYIKSNYECFEAFADLYCYFFEKGISILKEKGYLNFITSNSFLKAEYGKPLRDFFNEHGQFIQLINLEDAQIFDDAIVNTVIANFAKGTNNLTSKIVNHKYDLKNDFIDFIEERCFKYTFNDFNLKSWNLAKPEHLKLGMKIAEMGPTLEELGTKIRLGIATGSNDAFVIGNEVVSKLVSQDPNSLDLIKPLLRGRDINRFNYQQEKYILLTKNGVNVEKDYPAIFEYLDSFGDNFKKRGAKGNHWSNLRACSFFEDFKEPKVIWIELTDTNKFTICYDEIYLLNSAYFLIPPLGLNINFLTGILNSKVIKFYLKLIANTSGVGTTRWINVYVKDFPIARNEELEKIIEDIVEKILIEKNQNPIIDTKLLENQIDQLVYELYGLTEEEIKILKGGEG